MWEIVEKLIERNKYKERRPAKVTGKRTLMAGLRDITKGNQLLDYATKKYSSNNMHGMYGFNEETELEFSYHAYKLLEQRNELEKFDD